MFIVDAGNLFFKKDNTSIGIPMENALINSNIIVDSFNRMGCDAVNLGSKDFSCGLDKLKELEQKSEFPFISANIFNDIGINLFEPYTIVERDGIRLGIIGLTSVFNHEDIKVEEPLPILESLLNEVKLQSDFTILLFPANEPDIAAVRNSDLDIDLILQSKSTRRSNDGGNYNIPVYTCGDKGKYVYKFDVKLESDGDIVDLSTIDTEIQTLERNLRKVEKGNPNETVDVSTPEEQRRLNEIKRLKMQIGVMKSKMNAAGNTLSFERVEMGKNIIDEPEILLIVDAGKKELNALSSPQPAIPYNQKNVKRH